MSGTSFISESGHRSYSLWSSAGFVVLVAPVAAAGVDGVFAEDFAGVAVDHGDGVWIDEDGHRRTCMDGADAEVMHAAGAAEADLAEAVRRGRGGRDSADCDVGPLWRS